MAAFFQSSLAAARADNFYYPPEWTPNQVCQSIFVIHLKVREGVPSIFSPLTMCWHLDSHVFPFSGFIEQVSWSTCFEGESKKDRSGHPNNKVKNVMIY